MSGSEEEAASVNLRDDLAVFSSSEDEAVSAGRPEEEAMDDNKAPPAEQEAGTSAATSAGTAPEDRYPAEVARTEPTLAYACPKCTFTSASKGNLTTHVRRWHTDEDMMWQCGGCQKSYQRRDYLTRHQAAKPSCRGTGTTKIPRESSQPSEGRSPGAQAKAAMPPPPSPVTISDSN